MASDKFHLGWFLQQSSIQAWGEPWTGNIDREWMGLELFSDIARSLERACFDYLLLEDSSFIGEAYGNSRDFCLKWGVMVPRQDPAIVATALACATKRLGIVPTMAPFSHHPYLLARMLSSLDQISGGRAGWNMVTGSSDLAAQNYGSPALPAHDKRYEMAHEYTEAVAGLWDSWKPGAIIADRKNQRLIDSSKVTTVNYVGKYYKTRGPLNSGPSPQGRPVIAQAGASKPGRDFAAKYADIVIATGGADEWKVYRDDIRSRAIGHGRNPDNIKVMFCVQVILGETNDDAQLRFKRRMARDDQQIGQRLAFLGNVFNIDFAAVPHDVPIRELGLTTNGHQASLEGIVRDAGHKTLREWMSDAAPGYYYDLIGTPDRVAGVMKEMMQQSGGDGFLFFLNDVSRRTVAEITDGLVPALQERGLVRDTYSHQHFRDNLLEF
jgi:FMN-dependent oxidoreductase (nitrilotriacetate monooxygenase family)